MNTKALSCRRQSVCLSNARIGRRGVGGAAVLLVTLCLSLNAAGEPQKPEPQKHQDQPAAAQQLHRPAQKSSGISPQQAVSIAQQRQQGKVLSVKRSNGAYKVKMLHQGQVRYVTVSAD